VASETEAGREGVGPCAIGAPHTGSVAAVSGRSQRGAASIEHVALAAAIALIAIAAIAAVRSAGPDRGTRELGEMIGRRIACAPRYPVPCGRHPLALAYGFPVGKLVRHLVPSPAELGAASPSGTLLPVDFRRCRRASCALAGSEPGLTASNRRVTVFASVSDGRRAGGPIRISYWLYRPTLGWELIERTATAPDLVSARPLRLNREQLPDLVPLETLAGRDHYRFFGRERPPWRGRVPD